MDGADVRLDRSLCTEFYGFVRAAWDLVEPEPYVDGQHLRLSCSELERWARAPGSRLVWNVPPQTGKSLLACVLLPAWVWTWWPEARFICTSYEKTFSERDGRKMLDLCSSPWYRTLFPAAACSKDSATANFQNRAKGLRFGTSMEAGAMGRHGHFLIADDPIKPVDAFGRRAVNRIEIDECVERWKSAFARAVLPGGRKLVVMQRLHKDDLAGYCVRRGYRHALFSMRAEPGRCPETEVAPHECVQGERSSGDLLWPERFPEHVVTELEDEMGPAVAAAQLQQRPSPLLGGFFRRETFRYWERPPNPGDGTWFQSWDLTFGSKTSSASWVVGQLWWAGRAKRQIHDRVRARLSFTETVQLLLTKGRDDPAWKLARAKVIEKKANGAAVMETLEHDVPGLVPWPEQGVSKPSKESCWNAVQPYYRAGNIEHPPPSMHPWVRDYEERLIACGGGDNDDADATAQALLYARHGTSYRQFRDVIRSAMGGRR